MISQCHGGASGASRRRPRACVEKSRSIKKYNIVKGQVDGLRAMTER
jgi:hypothetical protein